MDNDRRIAEMLEL